MPDYLFELGTEELPARHTDYLRNQIHSLWKIQLEKNNLSYNSVDSYSTPRRLVLLTYALAEKQKEQHIEQYGPWIDQAFDQNGKPTKAALGFAKSCSVKVESLHRRQVKGRQRLCFLKKVGGVNTIDILQNCFDELFGRLHLPKTMHWGEKRHSFIRPVRWICSVYGKTHAKLTLYGVQSTAVSYGHRFLCPQPIAIDMPGNYLALLKKANVIVDQNRRREIIQQQIDKIANEQTLIAQHDETLLTEIGNLVEYPQSLLCQFDKRFLRLPQDVLIASMVQHQKYVHLVNSTKAIQDSFIAVSNIPDVTGEIAAGNSRVLEPRLRDAEFFYKQDIDAGIDTMVTKLKDVVFDEQLGSIAERCQRMKTFLLLLIEKMHMQAADLQTAADLCKADLVSAMVMEFPKLQGIMGSHYARKAGYSKTVSQAIEEHYLPRFSADSLPSTDAGKLLAIADRMDMLTGMFLLDRLPSAEKDPYGLRRAALGIIRIAEHVAQLPHFSEMIKMALQSYQHKLQMGSELDTFFLERLRRWHIDKGINANIVTAVSAVGFGNISDFANRVASVAQNERQLLSELGTMCKRIAHTIDEEGDSIHEKLFTEPAEKKLFTLYCKLQPQLETAIAQQKYTDYFQQLGKFIQPVHDFFDHVMVQVDDEAVKRNRKALLFNIHQLSARVVDISRID